MERCSFIPLLRRTLPGARWSRTVRFLTFLLVQYALAVAGLGARSNSRLPPDPARHPAGEAEHRPYLQVASSRAFRIKPELPPPDLSSKPAAGGAPPGPGMQSLPAPPAAADLARVEAPPGSGHSPADQPKPSSLPAEATAVPDLAKPPGQPAGARPEDFLPFFQIPDRASLPGSEVPPLK